jgi:calcyphosin
MNQDRLNLVLQAFHELDQDNSGSLDIRDIRTKYDAKKHPQVIMHQKTEDEVLEEFLHTFEANRGNNDNKVSQEEWVEYYTNISASIDDDSYFSVMINNSWNLDK